VTWISWIVSIEIDRKCFFNARFFSFYIHLCLLRNSKVLFARAQRGKVVIFGSVRTNTNILPGCCVSCGCFFQRTSFNCVLTLVHPLVLQLREYPLNPATFNQCYFYLRTIFTLFFPSQFCSFSAACSSTSIHSLPDTRLCGVVLNRPRTLVMTRSD